MRIQITLTSPEGKRIIAKGIKALPRVQEVRKEGKIVLKGGTTVSAVSEELCGEPMKIDQIYQKVKGSGLSGEPRNLIPCQRGSLSCKNHIGCLYKKGMRK